MEEEKEEEEQKEEAEAVEEAEVEEKIEEAPEIKEGEEKEAEIAEEVVEAKEEEMPAPAEEEEAKLPPKEGKVEEEEEIVEERIYTIPLGKAWIMPPKKRAPKAMRMIRGFLTKHMKLERRVKGEEEEEPKRLIISNEVNAQVWRRSIEKPPRKIRVRAAKDKEGNVTVYLAEGD
jgi:large subunit ribosomal protein L31e